MGDEQVVDPLRWDPEYSLASRSAGQSQGQASGMPSSRSPRQQRLHGGGCGRGEDSCG